MALGVTEMYLEDTHVFVFKGFINERFTLALGTFQICWQCIAVQSSTTVSHAGLQWQEKAMRAEALNRCLREHALPEM